MKEDQRKQFPFLINLKWRKLLEGKNHILIANIFSDFAYSSLKMCARQKILDSSSFIKDGKKNDIDSDDISHVSSLYRDFYPTFDKDGNTKYKPFFAITMDAIKSDARLQENRKLAIKKELKLLEYEAIVKIISLARNKSSHDQGIISDIGYVLKFSSSVLRLIELCDESNYQDIDINNLRSDCIDCISTAVKQGIKFNQDSLIQSEVHTEHRKKDNQAELLQMVEDMKNEVSKLSENIANTDNLRIHDNYPSNHNDYKSNLLTIAEARQKLYELAEEIRSSNKLAKDLIPKQFFLSNIMIEYTLKSKKKIINRNDWENDINIAHRYHDNIDNMKPLVDMYWSQVENVLRRIDR